MTIDERLQALTQTVERLAQMHRDNERANAENFTALAQRSIQFMDTMNRVGRILEIHEQRLDSNDERLDGLEGDR